MKKEIKIIISIVLCCVVFFALGNIITIQVRNEKWIGQMAYCDALAGNWYRGEVMAEKGKYIYLGNVEGQCFIGCNCDEYYCDKTSKYRYGEWYTVEDEYYKVWNKEDCYIENDIDSLINYKNRR